MFIVPLAVVARWLEHPRYNHDVICSRYINHPPLSSEGCVFQLITLKLMCGVWCVLTQEIIIIDTTLSTRSQDKYISKTRWARSEIFEIQQHERVIQQKLEMVREAQTIRTHTNQMVL